MSYRNPIKDKMEEKGWTAKQLDMMAGTNMSTKQGAKSLKYWESASENTLRRMCHALKLPADETIEAVRKWVGYRQSQYVSNEVRRRK